jgi:hypothetical protein
MIGIPPRALQRSAPNFSVTEKLHHTTFERLRIKCSALSPIFSPMSVANERVYTQLGWSDAW